MLAHLDLEQSLNWCGELRILTLYGVIASALYMSSKGVKLLWGHCFKPQKNPESWSPIWSLNVHI